MSTTEITTYTCDGCGKEENWPAVARQWTSIELKSVAWLGASDRRRRESTVLHACSSACEKRIHLQRAGQSPDPEQLEAEARAALPDLARRLDELVALHSQQLKQQESEHFRQLQELRTEIFELGALHSQQLKQQESEHLRQLQAPTLRNLISLFRRADGGRCDPPTER